MQNQRNSIYHIINLQIAVLGWLGRIARDGDFLMALLRNCLPAAFIGFMWDHQDDGLARIKNIFMPCLQTLWRGRGIKIQSRFCAAKFASPIAFQEES